ncbi:hypothetical protein K435DRAFT_643849 [Dendrothele bispora CBS 962.96]|uniref:Uncharacterized protein n=1 Tax=Dendrothele bispora (strain CBS 962.96) TaxID=1314807 RepID=A0A4S8MVR8_DENBC|nr:hypothetical protein K435DRAFT_643849 [Dendrothele bispora CBS 962.96]
MYNSQVNNPFVSDPTNAQSRYPDIDSTGSPGPSSTQFTSWLQSGTSSNGFQMNQQPGMYQQQQPQPQPMQQQYMGGFVGNSGFASPQLSSGSGFQPTSNFGQMMTGQVNGSGYGYLAGQGNPVPQQQTSYNPVQQQLQSPSYIPSLDPYASIGQGWDGSGQQQPTMVGGQGMQSPVSPGGSLGGFSGIPMTTSTSSTGQPHPREYVRTHKAELEAWDQYTWKQLLNKFDDLKEAWQARKKEIDGKVAQLQMQMQYSGGGYYAMQFQQEIARLQGLSKEADSHHDSVAASSFQVHEVFQNYRQSGDLASKKRTREASNSALQSLPDWPPVVY